MMKEILIWVITFAILVGLGVIVQKIKNKYDC